MHHNKWSLLNDFESHDSDPASFSFSLHLSWINPFDVGVLWVWFQMHDFNCNFDYLGSPINTVLGKFWVRSLFTNFKYSGGGGHVIEIQEQRRQLDHTKRWDVNEPEILSFFLFLRLRLRLLHSYGTWSVENSSQVLKMKQNSGYLTANTKQSTEMRIRALETTMSLTGIRWARENYSSAPEMNIAISNFRESNWIDGERND